MKSKNNVLVDRELFERLLISIDGYITENFSEEPLFLFNVKLSYLVNTMKDMMDIRMVNKNLKNIINVYKKLWKCARHIIIKIEELKKLKCNYCVFTSYVLLNNIFLKNYTNSIVNEIICDFERTNGIYKKFPNQMIIYTNEKCSQPKELSEVINLTAHGCIGKALDGITIINTTIPNELFHDSVFSSYQITMVLVINI